MIKNKISQLRQERGLSQEQLAEKAHVSVRTIQRLEAGDDASITTLNLVANALAVKVNDLFAEEADQQKKADEAQQQLAYQLNQRRQEFQIYKRLFNALFIIVMMVAATLLTFNNAEKWSSIFGILWACAWMLLKPLQRLLFLRVLDPQLDRKFPLTANRIDKDQE